LEDDHQCSVSFEGSYRSLFDGTVATFAWRDAEDQEMLVIFQF
jgi:hypothetical protein